jgi:drug/metabolite transporter (DMT)-like permease
VLCVVPLAAAMAAEHLSLPAIAGVALIVGALLLLGLSARNDRSFPPQAMLWTLLAGVASAGYVICDANGVRASGSALSYGCTASIANAISMTVRQRFLGATWQNLGGAWSIAIPTAIASMASYVLILWVWTRAPVAAGAALRDTSAVFAILIAVIFLRERFTRLRLAAVLLASAAVPLLRLT